LVKDVRDREDAHYADVRLATQAGLGFGQFEGSLEEVATFKVRKDNYETFSVLCPLQYLFKQ